MNTRHKRGLVLAIHPTSRGFGWVLFEAALKPVDWGLATVRVKRSADALRRFERLLDRYKPQVVVFEEFTEHPARRAVRIQALCRRMIALASGRGLYTPVFSRDTIRETFESSGAQTRRDIALSIAERIELFRRRLPRERKYQGESEDVRQSLFDAVALALTYFAVAAQKDTSSKS
jgi:hypothetical protein